MAKEYWRLGLIYGSSKMLQAIYSCDCQCTKGVSDLGKFLLVNNPNPGFCTPPYGIRSLTGVGVESPARRHIRRPTANHPYPSTFLDFHHLCAAITQSHDSNRKATTTYPDRPPRPTNSTFKNGQSSRIPRPCWYVSSAINPLCTKILG